MSASDKKKLRKEQAAAELTEKQQHQKKQDKQLKNYTVTFVIVMVLVVAIALGSMGVNWYNNTGAPARNTTALTIGDYEMSNAELNYYFIDTVNNFYDSMYQQYSSYTVSYLQYLYGLDLSSPLDAQVYNAETGDTWADYFLNSAIESAKTTYALYNAAKAEGYEMSEDYQSELNNALAGTETIAGLYGFSSLEEYLKAMYGNSANEETFVQYYTATCIADAYYADHYYDLEISQDEIEAYNAENYDNFSTYSYSYYYLSVTDYAELIASGIIVPETEGAEDSVEATEPVDEADTTDAAESDEDDDALTEEERAVAQAQAKSDADWLAEANTALILDKKLNQLKSNVNDKKATAVTDAALSSVSSVYADWIKDQARQAGDTTVIEYESESDEDDLVDGYYVILFQGRKDYNDLMVNVRHILVMFEGGSKDEDGNTVYSDEEKQTAYDAAKAIYDEWLAGDADEDSFGELAYKNSDDSSYSNYGLIENIYPGQTVTNFNDWIFAEGRTAGDHTLLETEYGYHIIYFSSWDDMTYREYCIDSTLRSEATTEWYDSLVKDVKAVEGKTDYIQKSIILVPTSST